MYSGSGGIANMLPVELLAIVLRQANVLDWTSCRQVCQQWRGIIDAMLRRWHPTLQTALRVATSALVCSTIRRRAYEAMTIVRPACSALSFVRTDRSRCCMSLFDSCSIVLTIASAKHYIPLRNWRAVLVDIKRVLNVPSAMVRWLLGEMFESGVVRGPIIRMASDFPMQGSATVLGLAPHGCVPVPALFFSAQQCNVYVYMTASALVAIPLGHRVAAPTLAAIRAVLGTPVQVRRDHLPWSAIKPMLRAHVRAAATTLHVGFAVCRQPT